MIKSIRRGLFGKVLIRYEGIPADTISLGMRVCGFRKIFRRETIRRPSVEFYLFKILIGFTLFSEGVPEYLLGIGEARGDGLPLATDMDFIPETLDILLDTEEDG